MTPRVLSRAFMLAALVILVPTASVADNTTTPDDPPDTSPFTLKPCRGGGLAFCWHNFMWNNGPGVDTQIYTLNLTSQTNPTELRITDAFAGGDIFTVTVSDHNGNILTLNTSLVPKTATTALSYLAHSPPYYFPTSVQNDPDAAWLSHYHSKLSLWLPVGCVGCKYTIEIKLAQSAISDTTPLNGGRAFIRAEYYVLDANGNIIPPGDSSAGPGVILPADARRQTMTPDVTSTSKPSLQPLDINGRLINSSLK